ncbi:hypothetical protein DL546_000941 [Coniochaeta pulveracea]|uniref:Conserved oligomeric Golgi complex subunit 2 n=1 Tax=Coniochaeta pulveracea TaxID=177199 RepID=A0A420YB23_9PEZI|nr:hypothetical protein DL546_000941 [Coniochaeta pulveracea]
MTTLNASRQRNYAPSSRASSPHSSSNEDAPLPFPTALPRSDFLSPTFDAATYLSNLHTASSRHQSLSDLRTELRERSAAISAELLELVNSNYASFLGLGDELRGGADKVGDVRVALLGYKRQVEEVKRAVGERREEVRMTVGELRGVGGAVELGRGMEELGTRVELLEKKLVVGSYAGRVKQDGVDGKAEDDGFWEEEGSGEEEGEDVEGQEDEAGFVGSSPAKLGSLARDYVLIERLADSLGTDLPFVRKMEERIMRYAETEATRVLKEK